ncbi:hypothetical protein IC006_0640 [Sulfuracidifex tepidarius]|uniref:HTH marR-type domain-containing protein n=2 Tax=Sulfuracidifex tepidarius TaxID=1294262 RepID=A0A510E0V8_9CREN|nr:hypothetical protein IC006_0640 [Sulfuracidifex tepidarius]BBG26112.1 hypothetical protein IC007_0617 [Sulfuracidifex tepidarius]
MTRGSCVKFSEIEDATGLHSQTLSRILDRLIEAGLIRKCFDFNKKDRGYAALVSPSITYLDLSVYLEHDRVTDKSVVLKHRFKCKIINNSIPISKVSVYIYGDIEWTKPFIFKTPNTQNTIPLTKEICPNNYCHFIMDLGKVIEYGEKASYDYEFYLYYFPPEDYFDIFYHEKIVKGKVFIRSNLISDVDAESYASIVKRQTSTGISLSFSN